MSTALRKCRQGIAAAFVVAAVLSSPFAGAQQAPAQPPAAPQAAPPPPPSPILTGLRQGVQRLRDQERQLAQEREQRFRAELQRVERQAQEATQRRNAAEARSTALDRQWNENEQTISETNALLAERQGNLGELFGVTRQVAGDAATMLQQSLISSQYPPPTDGGEERADFLRRLAGATALPSITELERLWYEMLREMTDAAKVVRYRAAVAEIDNAETPEDESQIREERDVVRVGPFTASSNGQYLGYTPGNKSLTELNGELVGELQALGRNLQAATPGSGYQRALVDPASGALLGLYLERPNMVSRIEDGEEVGYAILFVGGLGVLLAIFQGIYLLLTRAAVSAQLRKIDDPKPNNPLGRVLLAFRGDGKRIENAELAELRISEASYAKCRASNGSSRSCGSPSRPVRCWASSAPSSA